jgi:RNA polymerase sigma factor (sigma-70 family)
MGSEKVPAKESFLVALSQEHRQSLERYLARKLDNPADASDVAQEAFLRLHRLQQPEQLENPRAFLFQVASNLAIDQLRRRSLHQKFLNNEQNQSFVDEPVDINANGISPEQLLSAREKLEHIYAAIEELPDNCKQAFLMHRNTGMSYSDIAGELGVSVSSIEKYILQALKHCRLALAQYYDEEPPRGPK